MYVWHKLIISLAEVIIRLAEIIVCLAGGIVCLECVTALLENVHYLRLAEVIKRLVEDCTFGRGYRTFSRS